MDLALALVEEDHGHPLALAVARKLMLFLRRPDGQKQFSTVLSAQTGPASRLGDLLAWIEEDLNRPLPIVLLAARACLSPRQFVCVFRRDMREQKHCKGRAEILEQRADQEEGMRRHFVGQCG